MNLIGNKIKPVLLVVSLMCFPLTVSADRDRNMMGGGMMGGGMMGMGPIYMLDLSDTQRSKIRTIQRQLRRSHFDAMEKMADHHETLWKLYRADTRNPKQIGAVYGKIFAIKQKMIESSIEQSNRMEAVLTKEQRKQLRAWRRNMGMGMGYGGRGNRDRERMHREMMDR